MIKGIKKVITDGLAKEVGETLKQELDRLYQIEKDHKGLMSKTDILLLDAKKMQEYIYTHGDLKQFENDLNSREKEVIALEQRLKESRLEYSILIEKEKSEFCKNVALGLVRNQEYNTNVFKNKTSPATEQNGYNQQETIESSNINKNIS